ncbi:hypothetical protein FPQ18DRAFT_324005 [Pyronema domesticum]|uniref:Uncharacterized protein n=1 Tax=Pyronema omphalodes (strain CBS 100304) TaxID=1076935 RepID=U4KXI1_PYROM|nr:hypothetical protein FPQ18DRAFT_324005 [Pyronema domesticum]CCX06862.1 Similar to hypothetical protein SNOG_14212 [Phaeosphaeria nodorum SN15]; acc. no. XP_001804409 [Pyronema omphalodes CBS 100304]
MSSKMFRPLLRLLKPSIPVSKKPMATMTDLPQRLNIHHTPLSLHSLNPITGFARDGYCHAPSSDPGNHSIAAIVTDEFLNFSKDRGNDLTSIGLKGGCKWCLCVNRWMEAVNAYGKGELSKEGVPKVVPEATGLRALEGTTKEELERWKVGK